MREVDNIKAALISTCTTGDFKNFEGYYFSDHVVLSSGDKAEYSIFFKELLSAAFSDCKSDLTFDFKVNEDSGGLHFFDPIHLHAELTVYVFGVEL
jgi:hypothetical protein